MTMRLARTTDVSALRTIMRQARGAKFYLVTADGRARVRVGRAADESTLQLLVEAMRFGGRVEIVVKREMIESDVVAAR
jgi:hypothetical protein